MLPGKKQRVSAKKVLSRIDRDRRNYVTVTTTVAPTNFLMESTNRIVSRVSDLLGGSAIYRKASGE
jgi:hypothetical protein